MEDLSIHSEERKADWLVVVSRLLLKYYSTALAFKAFAIFSFHRITSFTDDGSSYQWDNGLLSTSVSSIAIWISTDSVY